MRRWNIFLAIIAVVLFIPACSSSNNDGGSLAETEESSTDSGTDEMLTSDESDETVEPQTEEEEQEEHGVKIKNMNCQEFDELLATLPISVIHTRYVVQNEENKILYPDVLQAVIQSNFDNDIKNATVAFVAWDKNNLPVKIKSHNIWTDADASYIQQVSYNDINLVPGGTYGENAGYEIDESCGISSFKAIVVDFETFDGTKWKNPYYAYWVNLYGGVKYSDDLSIKVFVLDNETYTKKVENVQTDKNIEDSEKISETELEAQIAEQEVRVISTKYAVQSNEHKTLYPDMLQAVIQNGTEYDIKDAVVAFVAWDKNNLPVKIKSQYDYSGGSYVRKVAYNGINLVPGTSYGENSGYEIDESCGISSFKAIVVSFETFEGETWDNPLFGEWCDMYEGKKRESSSALNSENSDDSGLMIGSRTIGEIRQKTADAFEKKSLYEFSEKIRQVSDDELYEMFNEVLDEGFQNWESESNEQIDAYVDVIIKFLIEGVSNE